MKGPNFMMHEEQAFKSSSSKGSKMIEKLPSVGSFLLGGMPMLGRLVGSARMKKLKVC